MLKKGKKNVSPCRENKKCKDENKRREDSRSKHSEKADKTAKVLLALFVVEKKLNPN